MQIKEIEEVFSLVFYNQIVMYFLSILFGLKLLNLDGQQYLGRAHPTRKHAFLLSSGYAWFQPLWTVISRLDINMEICID